MVSAYVDLRRDAKKTRVEKEIALHTYVIVYHIVWDLTYKIRVSTLKYWTRGVHSLLHLHTRANWFKLEAKTMWRYFINHNLYRKFRCHLNTLALHYQICSTCLLIGPTMHKCMMCTSKFAVYMLILEERGRKRGGGGGWKFIDQMV